MTQLEWDIMATVILIFFVLFAFLIKEGAERAYDKEVKSPKNKLSKLYHIMSFFVRVGLFLTLGIVTKDFETNIKLLLLSSFAFISWTGYNIVINLFRKDKWYYVGTSGVDLVIRKVFFFINFDK